MNAIERLNGALIALKEVQNTLQEWSGDPWTNMTTSDIFRLVKMRIESYKNIKIKELEKR